MVVTQGPIGKNHLSVQSIILLGGVSSLLPYAHCSNSAIFQAAPELARNFLKPLGIETWKSILGM